MDAVDKPRHVGVLGRIVNTPYIKTFFFWKKYLQNNSEIPTKVGIRLGTLWAPWSSHGESAYFT
jgi:hypothetical protein